MGKKKSSKSVFDDPACNPFIDPEGIPPGETCLALNVDPTRIPESFKAYAKRVAAVSPRDAQPVPLEEVLDVPKPAGFETTEYQEKVLPFASGTSGLQPVVGGGKPQQPVLPDLPTGDPAAVTVDGIIAANRFGLGARPGELAEASTNPTEWLKAQLTPQAVLLPYQLPKSHECVLLRMGFLEDPATTSVAQAAIDTMERYRAKNTTPGIPQIDDIVEADNIFGKILFQEIRIRDYIACTTRAPFAERLVRFWTNHFAVTMNNNTGTMVGDFERTVSRRYYLHKFSDIFIASTLHPAMLHFLNNVVSIGPNSPYGATIGNPPANENLAREALELHSMGSGGGYSQTDVEELAKALTGCITGYPFHGPDLAGHFLFEPLFHEPGTRTFLGTDYGEENGSPAQVIAILNDVARHPATISRMCRKIVAHFVSDNPPQTLVDNLISVWEATDGQLSEIYKALVDNPLAWSNDLDKFKTPNDLVNSAARAVRMDHVFGANEDNAEFRLYLLYLDLGQFPFTPPTPEGWSDDGIDWAQPSPMMARMQWADAVASRVGTINPNDFLTNTVGPDISADTAFWTGGAATPQQGITLSIMSPEFQRR